MKQPSLPARIFGLLLVFGAIGVIALGVNDIVTKVQAKTQAAKIHVVKELAPLQLIKTVDLPQPLTDPRSFRTWPIDGKALFYASGTDGKVEVEIAGMIDPASGEVLWSQPLTGQKITYCLPQLWEGQAVCESPETKKIVVISPSQQVVLKDFPQWELATGEHLIAGVFDKMLMVHLGVAGNNSSGSEIWYLRPDMSVRTRFPLQIPQAVGAQPLYASAHGAQSLQGVTTVDVAGKQTNHWAYSINRTMIVTRLDLTGLGDQSQASMLESGVFASSDPNPEVRQQNAAGEVTQAAAPPANWKIYNSDGAPLASGSAPVEAVRALHEQLRLGYLSDADTIAKILNSGQIPAIMNLATVLGTSETMDCPDWNNCVAQKWQTNRGIQISLPSPGKPLLVKGNTAVFTLDDSLAAYGLADGKSLWSGIIKPEPAISGRQLFAFDDQLWQSVSVDVKGQVAKAQLRTWAIP